MTNDTNTDENGRMIDGRTIELVRYTVCRGDDRRIVLQRAHPAHDEVRVQTHVDGEWRNGRWTTTPARKLDEGYIDEICEGFEMVRSLHTDTEHSEENS